MVTVEQQGEQCRLTLEGEVTIYQAEALAREVLPRLDAEGQLVLDLAGVTELDSSGVQLLLLAKRERDRAGGGLSLVHHSDAVVEVFERLELWSFFKDPVVLSGSDGNASAQWGES